MNASTRAQLAERRGVLRARMQAQRTLIAERLGPARGPAGAYPRSRTMQFLSQRPELAIALLAALASLAAGTRFARPLGAMLDAARAAGAVATNGAGWYSPTGGQ